MHSPEVLAFSILRPWPKITKRTKSRVTSIKLGSHFWYIGDYELYFPSLIDVWHIEPGGADALTVCKDRIRDKDGKFVRWSHTWKWHFWHYKVSWTFIYGWRRRLLTRCAECGGPSRKGNVVNHSFGGNRVKVPLYIGEQGLYHSKCMSEVSKRMHEHDPRGCYACSGKASFEFKRRQRSSSTELAKRLFGGKK